MKIKSILSTLLSFSIVLSFAQNKVVVPAGQSIEIDYPEYAAYDVALNTVGLNELDVAVINRETKDQVRGFGLGKMGKAEVMVEKGSVLILQNDGNEEVKVNYEISPRTEPVAPMPSEYVELTLRNNSLKSIPLIIPTVMNPNLSPKSNSGVSLKLGQEIFFKAKGKKQLLLTITDAYKDGDVIEVDQVLSKRQKELGVKK